MQDSGVVVMLETDRDAQHASNVECNDAPVTSLKQLFITWQEVHK